MDMTNNTILITGGGSGIGRGFAEAFHRLGNTVIIAGRRRAALDEVVARNPGMHAVEMDVNNADSITAVTAQITQAFPALNVLINNAGIMQVESVHDLPGMLAVAEATITTNLLGPIRVTNAVLGHFQQQAQATVLNVTSGLAYVPRMDTPTYNATKAGLHAYSESLRALLRGTTIQVTELVTPLTATELTPGQSQNPRALPLQEYIDHTMQALREQPDAHEIVIERARFQRYAERENRYDQAFSIVNGLE